MRYETITKNGKKFVVLPKDDFERLQQDAEMISDIKAYDDAKSDDGEYFPADVVHAIIRGENPVKIYRQFRNMTQEELSSKTGISRAYLAQIETGKKKGSISVFKSIARALNVEINDLVK